LLLHCGLELRHDNIFAALVTEDNKIVVKKLMPNNLESLVEFLEPYRSQITNVIMEETANWRMIAGPLAERGFRTTVI